MSSYNFILTAHNKSKKLLIEDKFRASTLLEKVYSVIAVTRDFGVPREAIYQLKRPTASLPPGMVPQRKSCSGAPKKTILRNDKLLKRKVKSNPAITAIELKSKYLELLRNVATRTIRHRLQKGLGFTSPPCRKEVHARSSNKGERRLL